jgi:hypothetical protein
MVQVRLNDGSGIFGPQVTYPTAPCSFPQRPRVIDVDRDGILDVAYACISGSTSPHFGVLRGIGGGAFQAGAIVHPLPEVPSELALADFNGDGFLDVAASAYAESAVIVQHGTAGGTFGPMSYFFPTSTRIDGLAAIVAGDLDGDQVLDLATVSKRDQTLHLLRGAREGLFYDPVSISVSAGGEVPGSLHAGDLNSDGRPDFLIIYPGDFAPRVSLVLSNP